MVLITGLMGLVACGENEEILAGERVGLRDGAPGAVTQNAVQITPVALPAARQNDSWTHRGGEADHAITHPALGATLTRAFSTDIGAGNSRGARITADPVVADGRIFAMDAGATVTGLSTAGGILWQRDVTPANDAAGEASGGGLAYGDGLLVVNTGFGDTLALDPVTGQTIWTQDLDAPGSAAPTIAGGLVYVVGRDGRAWALDADNGRVQWTLDGTPATANMIGGAGAAVTSDFAVIPFPSGEIIATFPEGGLRRWSTVIAGERLGQAASPAAGDIASDPVISGDRIYVGNAGGRIVAMNIFNGTRLWTATEGATSPVWPVGDDLFAINDLRELIRLDAATGAVVWRVAMPDEIERRFYQRGAARHVHYGPVLAGGRLIVASSDGALRQFNPATGDALGEVALPGGAASHPVVAGGVLYVVSGDGQLHAFR